MSITMSCISKCTETVYPTNTTLRNNFFKNIQVGDILQFRFVCRTNKKNTHIIEIQNLRDFSQVKLTDNMLSNFLQDFRLQDIKPTYIDSIQKRLL